MSTSVSPRRSARLAAKASVPTSVPTPVTPRRTVRPSKPVAAKPRRYLTSDELAAELTLRQQLLTEASAILRLIRAARTATDFTACSDRADALWYTASDLITGGYDEMFIVDSTRYLEATKTAGSKERSYAIATMRDYIQCLLLSIESPPTWVTI
jgi:hypothetical protein